MRVVTKQGRVGERRAPERVHALQRAAAAVGAARARVCLRQLPSEAHHLPPGTTLTFGLTTYYY